MLGMVISDDIVVGKLNPVFLTSTRPSGVGVNGFISGKTTELGVGVSRRVMCYHRLSGALSGITISDMSGDYVIKNLISGVAYYVVAIDESGDSIQYNAVTQDLITASEVTV